MKATNQFITLITSLILVVFSCEKNESLLLLEENFDNEVVHTLNTETPSFEGTTWKVSHAGLTEWVGLNSIETSVEVLLFGDFNGDDELDAFYADGEVWRISYSCTDEWVIVRTSAVPTKNLLVGDFNNDGDSDIFYANGEVWRISYSATSDWDRVRTSAVPTKNLLIGDFNNDGDSDIFYANGEVWRISYSATSDWDRVRTSTIPTGKLKIGDFNNDEKSDVFTTYEEIFKIYVSVDGNDGNSGIKQSTPIKTIVRAQEILFESLPETNVEIHINQGNYLKQEVIWTYSNGKKITFTAKDFSKDRPVFDGVGRETWFKLNETSGINTNLNFRYIKVKNYKLGVYLKGNRCDPDDGWNGNNHFYGMYFENIGNKFTINKNRAVAAIDFVNSRNNSVINCHFVNIENVDYDPDDGYNPLPHLHGLYIAHYSSNNEILRNRFEKITGDPVRIRDACNYNKIEDNKFIKTGDKAFFSDWYCTGSTCTKPNSCPLNPDECPSYGNEFRNNDCNKNYWGDKPNLFILYKDDDYCGTLPDNRLRTSGNTNH